MQSYALRRFYVRPKQLYKQFVQLRTISPKMLLYGLYGLGSLRAMAPACWQDVVWYLRAVPRALACGPQSIGGSAPPILRAWRSI